MIQWKQLEAHPVPVGVGWERCLGILHVQSLKIEVTRQIFHFYTAEVLIENNKTLIVTFSHRYFAEFMERRKMAGIETHLS